MSQGNGFFQFCMYKYLYILPIYKEVFSLDIEFYLNITLKI